MAPAAFCARWKPSVSARTDECRRAAEWLRSVQNPDGGFGESILSYYDPTLKAKGKSTASQTAWGLIGLLAVVGADDPRCRARRRLARFAPE